MGDNSKIEWTEATWNPVTGCTKVSQGCKNCYAEGMAKRLQAMGQERYRNGFKVTLQDDPKVLEAPLRWKKPRLIFVNSMSDLFHEDVPTPFIQRVYAVMKACPHHTFQVLTKRPERMERFLRSYYHVSFENIWHGVSVENQEAAVSRIGILQNCHSAVRFISFEPLLGSVGRVNLSGIHWAIVGGESGPNARPMSPEWAREIRDRCQIFGTNFFFKQWGEWAPLTQSKTTTNTLIHTEFGLTKNLWMAKVGKHKAGRILDGRTWDEMPAR